MDSERVVIAEIMRPRGNRGELMVRSQTDVPGRLESLKRAQVQLADGSDLELDVEETWEHKGDWVVKFAGVDSINAAERFKGADVWVSRSERASLPEGDYFQSDLLGCSVIDSAGKRLGSVEGWQRFGGPPLLEVSVDGREVLVPFVDAICRKVDLEARAITVDLPEGLLEL
ncbi:MAG: ribosome maturation factor RimM [Acidobacteriota bacterium]|nr:ribosome maturation factor RimM [Acidobacteriota bacterium]